MKIIPFLELFDETLDINSTENYELSVQAGFEGLSYCILDTLRNKFVLIRSFEPDEGKYFNIEKLGEIISSDDFLLRKFRKVVLFTPSQKFTLVPAALYDPGKKNGYFTFNHTSSENYSVLSNKLTDPDVYVVFSVQRSICELLNVNFPGLTLNHHLKPLIWYISQKKRTITGNYIHIHIEREFFNIVIYGNHELKFCNTFTYRNISDILYYVMNVFKRLDLKQEETIYFSGRTEKYDDISSNFSIYVRNIRFSEPYGGHSFSYVFNETEMHRFLNLFSAINCE